MNRYALDYFRIAQVGDVVIPKRGRFKGMQGIVESHWDFSMFPTNKLCVVFYIKQLDGTVRKDVHFYKSKHLEVCHFMPLLNQNLRVGDEVFLLADPDIPLDTIAENNITSLCQKITGIKDKGFQDYFFISSECVFISSQIDINNTNLHLSHPDAKATHQSTLPTL